ncbi:peptide ABC transporter substrate-binding protein [Sporolactobacillus sp. CPB3-1]|uniref:Peptide ABC transporter substrate-binding protein n=1 Tax=Sporolactobacillus mangiferae TaxID=2940498 RepID=A0ABT0M854_9BACL|nr:peptide ABC transporter substrate-binding protein [Sporolactobacillus mangiferae]MCL1631044.1 peptide ABC transporter substrate-binding protein [Sporolactobacillus mangiferae]
MKKAKWSLVLSIVLALSLVLSACGSSKSSDNGKGSGSELAKDQTLNLASSADIPTLDPNLATDTTSTNVIDLTEAGLTRMHNNKYHWDLAKGAPKVSADKKTVTFTLRDGIKWSDGKAITAQDFVYGWHRQNDPAAKPAYNFLFAASGIKNAAKIEDPTNKEFYGKYDKLGVKALDSKTLEVTFEQPVPPFFYSILSQPQFYPQREDFVKKQGKKYAQGAENLLYSGPFVLEKWNKGSGWTYKKNKNYWNAKATKLDTVNVQVQTDLQTRVNLYKTDKIDAAGLTGEYVTSLKKSNASEIHTALDSGTFFLYLNQKTNKNLKNLNLRKAINAAIDRDSFVKVLFNDGSTGSNYVVPKGFSKGPDGKDFRGDNPVDGFPAGDAKDAKAYWDKAKKELGISKLELTFMSSDGAQYKQWDSYLANQLEKNLPGVKVTINQQPWANYLKLQQSFKFDIAFSGWFPDYQDPMTYLDMWTTSNPQNTTGWSNKKFDELIKNAQSETGNPSQRWKDMLAAEKTMMADYPIVPIYQSGKTWAQKSYVKGLSYPSYGPQVDFSQAYITKH